MRITRRMTYSLEFDSPEEKAAFENFAVARNIAKAQFNEGVITLEQCRDQYIAAGAAFKLATGQQPPYGFGRAKNPRVP